MSRRAEQVASVLHRAVQSVLSEGLADPRLDALITVTGVKVSPDLAEAVVSVSVTPADRESLVMHGLRAAAAHIRRQASELVSIHKPPRLVFKADRSVRKQMEILATLAEIERERVEPDAGDPGPSPTDTEPSP